MKTRFPSFRAAAIYYDHKVFKNYDAACEFVRAEIQLGKITIS